MTSPVSSCDSDFDAAEIFAASLMHQVDGESVTNMVDVQRDMLSRFEKTNEMLINFNILSANRFAVTSAQFRRNTQLMYEMKKDLDGIFKRIRTIKGKLANAYPDAFKVSGTSAPLLEDDEEETLAASANLTSDDSITKPSTSTVHVPVVATNTVKQESNNSTTMKIKRNKDWSGDKVVSKLPSHIMDAASNGDDNVETDFDHFSSARRNTSNDKVVSQEPKEMKTVSEMIPHSKE